MRSRRDGGDDDFRRSAEPTVSDTASTWRRQAPVERAGPMSPGINSDRRRGWGFNRQGEHTGEERPSGNRHRGGGDDRDDGRSPFNHSRRTSIESRGSAYGDSGPMNSPRKSRLRTRYRANEKAIH